VAVLAVLASLQILPAFRGDVLSSFDLVTARDPVFSTVAGDRTVGNPLLFDPTYVLQPDLMDARAQIRGGHLPLWSSGVGTGHPLLATQQHAALYPLNAPALVLPAQESLAWLLALKLLLAGVGVLVLARGLGLGSGPALLAAAAFCLSAYFIAWLQHPHANVWLLLPWLMHATRLLALRPNASHVALVGALGGAALLGGHPQSVLQSALLLVPWWIACRAWDRDDVQRHVRAAGAFVLAAVLAAAIGAVMWLPLSGALDDSYGASRAADPESVQTVVASALPEFWGRPDGNNFGGPGNWAERSIYVGVIPLLLALAGLRRPRRPPQTFLAFAALVPVLVAVDFPVLGDAVRAVPALAETNLNRLPIITVLALALLSGYGLQRITDGTPAERRRIVHAARWLAALPLLVLVVNPDVRNAATDVLSKGGGLFDLPSDQAHAAAGSLARWCLVAGFMLAVLAAMRRFRGRWAVVLVVAAAALDLTLLSAGYHTFLTPELSNPRATPTLRALSTPDPMKRSAGIGVLAPNLALRYGIRDARVHDHPAVKRYARLWARLSGDVVSSAGKTEFGHRPAGTGKLMDLTAVTRAASAPGSAAIPGTLRDRPPQRGVAMLANPDALPRAYFASGITAASSLDDALSRIHATPASRLRHQPVIEGLSEHPASEIGGAEVRIVKDRPDEVELEVSSNRPGVVVLLDAYARGWKAEVGGIPTTIHPANVAFRGVAVPAGRERVRFRYRPATAMIGGGISAAAVVLLAVAWLVGHARRWRRRNLSGGGSELDRADEHALGGPSNS